MSDFRDDSYVRLQGLVVSRTQWQKPPARMRSALHTIAVRATCTHNPAAAMDALQRAAAELGAIRKVFRNEITSVYEGPSSHVAGSTSLQARVVGTRAYERSPARLEARDRESFAECEAEREGHQGTGGAKTTLHLKAPEPQISSKCCISEPAHHHAGNAAKSLVRIRSHTPVSRTWRLQMRSTRGYS